MSKKRNLAVRLRNDTIGRIMQVETLNLILQEHRRHPWQQLYLFQWRHSPKNVLTLYDMDLPRRAGMVADQLVGWSMFDWWHHAHVCNVPADFIPVWPQTAMVKQQDGSDAKEVIRNGYKNVLVDLLRNGCIIPSKCLDDWLLDDSRKFCDPQLRLFYKYN